MKRFMTYKVLVYSLMMALLLLLLCVWLYYYFFFVFGLQSWEKKKAQSQVVFERDNTYTSRPGTSSRRLPNRSLNGSLDYSPSMNKRVPIGIQQLGSNNINSGNQGISFIKDGRKIQRKKIFDEPTFTFHMQDEASSIMSTHSGPFSP